MDTTSYIALSRQVGLNRQMTVIAGNVANANTPGFKAQNFVFGSLMAPAGEAGRVNFVQDLGTWRDWSPGVLNYTGNSLDVAIGGDGFFVVQTPNGERYTRAGAFKINDAGELITADGYAVLDDGGAPVILPPEATQVTIAEDGTISWAEGIIGVLQIVDFDERQDLRAEGSSLFASDAATVPAEDVRILQGRLEGSNVQPILEMTRLIETSRAFQNTQRLLETHHDMVRRAVEAATSASG